MSIFIRGMGMPKKCAECNIVQKTKYAYRCPLASREKGFSCTVSFGTVGIPAHCPLVEAPDNRWIPVTERLPEVNKYVLGYFKDGSMTAVCFFGIDEHMTFWRACTDEGWEADCDSEPTHWMPLPEPPKEEA